MTDEQNFRVDDAVSCGATLRTLNRVRHYPSTMPQFANVDQLKGLWRSRTEAVLKRDIARLPQAHMATMRDAVTFQNGFVRSKAGIVVQETTAGARNVAPPDDTQVVRHETRPAMLLRKPGDSDFAHWIVELLPRVREFRAMFPSQRLLFAVPGSPASMRAVRQRTLEWLGVGEDEFLWLGSEPTRFDLLHFITTNSIHSHTHDFTGLRHVSAQALAKVPHGKAHRRLYISREGATRCRLLNESDIMDQLAKRGFEIVKTHSMNIDEQVALFAEAEMVVGTTDTSMTNIVWAPEQCEVVSLSPDHGHEFLYWDIAGIRGQTFSFLFGESADPARLGHADFTADPAMLGQVVDAGLTRIARRK